MGDTVQLYVQYSTNEEFAVLYTVEITVQRGGSFLSRNIFDSAGNLRIQSGTCDTVTKAFPTRKYREVWARRETRRIAEAYAKHCLPRDHTVFIDPDGTITTKESEEQCCKS